MELAFERSPTLAAQRAALRERRGRLTTAETWPLNPELGLRGGARFGPDDVVADVGIEVSQAFQLGSQRDAKTAVARLEVDAGLLERARGARVLAARVQLAFTTATEAREILAVARTEVELSAALLDMAERRVAEGAGSQIDVNLAASELGRAEARAALAEGDYLSNRAALAEAAGLDPTAAPEPDGDLLRASPAPPALAELRRDVPRVRRDLAALAVLQEAARARIEVARAEVWPALGVSISYDREDGTDHIVGAGVTLPLPLFNRNEGVISEALAASQRIEAETAGARLAALRELAATHARFEAASRSAARLRERVVGSLEENLTLLRRAFEEGKRGWTDVLVIRRSLIDARRELIAATATARRSRVALDLAAGRLLVPDTLTQETSP